ncbi:hypothetical protein CLJ1_4146 [Pseudomonas paraeruginosa]|nr:hypothetical protein CLJ1_4146 [Pseudomonas aeruginosa]
MAPAGSPGAESLVACAVDSIEVRVPGLRRGAANAAWRSPAPKSTGRISHTVR